MFSGVPPLLRKKLYKEVIQPVRFNVLVTTYELVRTEATKLKKVPWQYLVVDEGHRLRNNSSKLSVCLTKEYKVRHRLLLTGTPLQVRPVLLPSGVFLPPLHLAKSNLSLCSLILTCLSVCVV